MHARLDPQDPGLAAAVRRLRELPAEARPPFDWVEFSRRAAGRPRGAAPRRWVAAAAASIAAVFVAFAAWNRLERPADVEQLAMPAPASVGSGGEPQWHRPDVAAGWLESLPAEPGIVRIDTRFAVTDLEDSIAWLDEMLTEERSAAAEPARVRALQRERTRLVDSLARVRYAETLAAELP